MRNLNTTIVRSSSSSAIFKMYCCLITSLFTVLTSIVTLAQQHNKSAMQSLSEECGILRPDQFYDLQKAVEETEFPWIGQLKDRKNELVCIVVLISRQYLITVASCFYYHSAEETYIVELGNCKIRQNCMVLSYIEKIIEHPVYTEKPYSLINDISLLRLEAPVTFTDYIQPICLPSADVRDMDYVAQHLTLTGRQIRGSMSLKLQVLIMDMTQCQKLYGPLWRMNGKVICACTCDNGGVFYMGSALMGVSVKNSHPHHYYLIGILSGAKDFCLDTTPDLFQSMKYHMDWIMENIAKLEGTA